MNKSLFQTNRDQWNLAAATLTPGRGRTSSSGKERTKHGLDVNYAERRPEVAGFSKGHLCMRGILRNLKMYYDMIKGYLY